MHKYIFLDTETHASTDPILIQLAYHVDGEDEYVSELYSTWGVPIDIEAMAVHHITEKHLLNKPVFSKSPASTCLEGLLTNHILVAHNALFDKDVLMRHNIETPYSICTLRLARYVLPELESHKLQYLRYYFGHDFFGEGVEPHNALWDVKVLEKVFFSLRDLLAKKTNLTFGEELDNRMQEISSHPSILYMCKFGKHKGIPWANVPKEYLSWIIERSDFTDEDVRYTAEYYLYQ